MSCDAVPRLKRCSPTMTASSFAFWFDLLPSALDNGNRPLALGAVPTGSVSKAEGGPRGTEEHQGRRWHAGNRRSRTCWKAMGEPSQSPSLGLCPLNTSRQSPVCCSPSLCCGDVYGTGGYRRWKRTTNGVPCVYSRYEKIQRRNLLRLPIVRGDPFNGVLGDNEARHFKSVSLNLPMFYLMTIALGVSVCKLRAQRHWLAANLRFLRVQ